MHRPPNHHLFEQRVGEHGVHPLRTRSCADANAIARWSLCVCILASFPVCVSVRLHVAEWCERLDLVARCDAPHWAREERMSYGWRGRVDRRVRARAQFRANGRRPRPCHTKAPLLLASDASPCAMPLCTRLHMRHMPCTAHRRRQGAQSDDAAHHASPRRTRSVRAK